VKKRLILCFTICVTLSLACSFTAGTPLPSPTPTAAPALSEATATPKAAPPPTAVPPTAAPTATGTPKPPVAAEPVTTTQLLWQVGSTSPELAGLGFSTLGGMDASNTAVYVADAYNGVYVFDLEGNYQGQLSLGEVGYVVDVALSPRGDVYVADAGYHLVARFDAEGALLNVFGGYGTGDGEFNDDGPAALAVDRNGNVYVLDDDDFGTRVQFFTPEGDYIHTFSVEEKLEARAMDVGPGNSLFLTGDGGYILELFEDGRVIRRLGWEALTGSFPQRLRVDAAGNFYVTTWGEHSVVKLDRRGWLLETIGEEGTNDGVTGWPAGEFLFPVGIALTGDGRYLFIGDGIGKFAFITAYRNPKKFS